MRLLNEWDWMVVGGCVAVLVAQPTARAAHWPESDIDHVRLTTAYTPDQGEFEIYQVTEFLNDGAPKSTKTKTRLEYGITDDVVVELVVPFKFRRPASGANKEGLGDIELEAKYRLLREPSAPVSLVAGFEVGVPTGDEERSLGEGNFKYEPILAVGKVIGNIALHQDAKLEFIRRTGGRGSNLEASTTSAIAWTPVEEFLEIEHPTLLLALDWKFVERNRTKIALIPAVGGEFEHLPVELEWGLGFPIGLTDAADNWGIISYFVFEF